MTRITHIGSVRRVARGVNSHLRTTDIAELTQTGTVIPLRGEEALVSLASSFDRDIREAQERVAQQEAFVRRMIARGTPTQSAEDRLRQLEQALSRMKEQHRRNRSIDVQRKIRDHRSR